MSEAEAVSEAVCAAVCAAVSEAVTEAVSQAVCIIASASDGTAAVAVKHFEESLVRVVRA